MAAKPTVFMLAGPNGAGKTTLYELRIAPHTAAPFINADLIQRDELRDPSMQASYKAAEIAERRRREHLAEGKDFVSESTFSHPSKLDLIHDAKDAGFRVIVYHVNLRSAELSVRRVAQRLEEGGHGVPEAKIRERFQRNPALIRQAVLQADRAYVYDNSRLNAEPALALMFRAGHIIHAPSEVPAWARDLYAKELEPFSPSRLNPAAASFAEARSVAARIGGQNATVRIAAGAGQTYEGKIVGETSLHWLQHEAGDSFVAHFKSSVRGDIKLETRCRITYSQRTRAHAERAPHPGMDAHDANRVRAEMFRHGRPEEVTKAYPELAQAYDALASLSGKTSGLTDAQRAAVMARARSNIALAIERGDLPSIQARDARSEKCPER